MRAQKSSETLVAYLFIEVIPRRCKYLPAFFRELQTRHGTATTVRVFSKQSLPPHGIQMIHSRQDRNSLLASV